MSMSKPRHYLRMKQKDGSFLDIPTAKIFLVCDHSMLSVVGAMRNIEDYRRETHVGALAFEPDERAEAYLQQMSDKRDYGEVTLERAGHNIILVRYAQMKKLPLFCLSRKNG